MSKADETFQESVQALAVWITFLEGKKRTYEQQLERASAQQPSQSAPAEEVVKEVPPEVGDAGTWVQVDTSAIDEPRKRKKIST